jgi:hypothetical protein
MSTCVRSVRFELRRNTKAGWPSNFILLAGEPGVETDTGQMKVGNGTTVWSELPYVGTTTAAPVQPNGFDGGNSESVTVNSSGPVFACGSAQ